MRRPADPNGASPRRSGRVATTSTTTCSTTIRTPATTRRIVDEAIGLCQDESGRATELLGYSAPHFLAGMRATVARLEGRFAEAEGDLEVAYRAPDVTGYWGRTLSVWSVGLLGDSAGAVGHMRRALALLEDSGAAPTAQIFIHHGLGIAREPGEPNDEAQARPSGKKRRLRPLRTPKLGQRDPDQDSGGHDRGKDVVVELRHHGAEQRKGGQEPHGQEQHRVDTVAPLRLRMDPHGS